MKVVGITGGIGSGKTTAAKMFALLGGMVYYSDIHSKRIINTTPQIKQTIIDQYGEDVFDEDGKVRGVMLAAIVFKDVNKLGWLNNLIYPYIMEDFKKWCDMWKDSDYCMIESAILVDCGAYKECDVVINVSCPMDVRVKRAMERDGTTEEQVMDKINNQVDETYRMSKADYVIWNSGTNIEYLQQQVNQIHKELSAK